MKIAVLAGGTSTERAISIVSGTEVAKALKGNGHDVFLIDMFCGCADDEAKKAFEADFDIEKAASKMNKDTQIIDRLMKEQKELVGRNLIEVCRKADVVFLALHGANGEDGKLQALLGLYAIPYTGTDYLSSAIAMDKSLTKQFFKWNQVKTPEWGYVEKCDKDKSLKELGIRLPVVVKPCCGGSSVGVAIARTEDEYKKAVADAFSYESRIIVEEYIEGREFSVAVVDGEAYPIIEIAPKEGFYDYKNKYSEGMTIETCPAEISDEMTARMQDMAVKGAQALGITGYCRLDFIMDKDGGMYCLEANTLPGMTPTSLIPREAAALGMSFPELCEKLIEISLKNG